MHGACMCAWQACCSVCVVQEQSTCVPQVRPDPVQTPLLQSGVHCYLTADPETVASDCMLHIGNYAYASID